VLVLLLRNNNLNDFRADYEKSVLRWTHGKTPVYGFSDNFFCDLVLM